MNGDGAARNPHAAAGAARERESLGVVMGKQLCALGDPRTGVSPYVDWPAYDVVAQAMGGMMSITGPKGAPTKCASS